MPKHRFDGSALRAARKEQGLTQQALADALGISKVIVNGWETGRGTPRMENLFRVAELLGVMPGDLLPNRGNRDELEQDAVNTEYVLDLIEPIPVDERKEFFRALRIVLKQAARIAGPNHKAPWKLAPPYYLNAQEAPATKESPQKRTARGKQREKEPSKAKRTRKKPTKRRGG